ncbi:hypothetical protein [Butyribacter intestini]|uniref:hypothetical protein n=1 Tax=Butyribacter intestini TaxID=1703332 RepID=UPI0022E4E74C|nr:hypothetical protein [Butyribacter intestini]
MSNLVQKVKWNLDKSDIEMYMYGEADFEANKAMQEPLEKLYQYENQLNMREKVKKYVGELETEIKRLEDHLKKHMNDEACRVAEIETRMETLQEVINDLKGRLEERV